jgi:MFS family permease
MLKPLRETWRAFQSIKGNARACVLVEPLWGIPYNLFVAYASVYMLNLGCTQTQVGVVISVKMASMMFFSLIGGYITDRLGRRRTTIIFDLIGWSIPTLIWGFARGFPYFLAGAVINSAYRVVYTSWTCLLVEDSKPEGRVHIYTWVHVAGILSGFFSPLAGIFVRRFGIVPAVRGLYFTAFVSMTVMFLVRNHFTHEPAIGLLKQEETRSISFRAYLRDYRRIVSHLTKNPAILIIFLILALNTIQITLRQTFFAILLTQRLGFPDASIALFPAVQSIVMLGVFLFVMPRIGRYDFKISLSGALLLSTVGVILLIVSPQKSYPTVIAAAVLTAAGTAVVSPMIEAMLANMIPDKDRAVVTSLLHVLLFALSTPFGYIGGYLSSIDERWPFALIGFALVLSILLLLILALAARKALHFPER